jgi:hypothetical protein
MDLLSDTSTRLGTDRFAQSPATCGGGLDHRHDAGADGLGESIPGGHDGGQIGITPNSIVGLGGILETF